MLDHIVATSFGKPEISADPQGFDKWTAQGVIEAPPIYARVPERPEWLEHTYLKSPWLYTEKSTVGPHVAFTDVGDLRFVHVGPSCPVPTDHPSIVLNTPASKVHVKLEDMTNTTQPRSMWDQWYTLKNSAPGGNGLKILGYQRPSRPTPSDEGDKSGKDRFIPMCFKSMDELDFFRTKYRMTVESVADPKDVSVKPWKDVFWLRPRPLCDTVIPTDFTIHNLPYGVFKTVASATPRIGCAIGDKIIDLRVLAEEKLVHASLSAPTLNPFMEQGRSVWRETRQQLQKLLRDSGDLSLSKRPDLVSAAVVPQAEATMMLPAQIGDYTDFYASEYHARNVGKIFRPNQEPLLPNWKHLPVGYHGRASSVVLSGTDVTRPSGQLKRADQIDFGPSEKLDFEVELGMFFGGPGNKLGEPIPVSRAKDHIFGVVLMNDWSARDIQFWEYVPLGPFLSKNFATTISPWIVPFEALEEFTLDLPRQQPEPLPYLRADQDVVFDIDITTRMNGSLISKTNSKYLYWSFVQMIAHHTASGCNLRAGDLLGSGTISAPEKEGYGSLLELTWNGNQPIHTSSGPRTFIQNNDVVEMTGYCEQNGKRIGFGSCAGRIVV